MAGALDHRSTQVAIVECVADQNVNAFGARALDARIRFVLLDHNNTMLLFARSRELKTFLTEANNNHMTVPQLYQQVAEPDPRVLGNHNDDATNGHHGRKNTCDLQFPRNRLPEGPLALEDKQHHHLIKRV